MEITVCSICIATYKRVQLLKLLLDNLLSQELPTNCKIEVIIVDNDPDKSAERLCLEYKEKTSYEIKYFVQHKKNISLTRNKSVEEASGEYLFFIDDDEYPCKDWIRLLLNTIKKYNADAVFGRVISKFDIEVPQWIQRNLVFNKPFGDTGTDALFRRTSNCIVKASRIKKFRVPFNPLYGLTGGEDTYLFDILKKEGAKYVNCKEACVYEYIPPNRANLRYILKKSLQRGNNYTRRKIELSYKNKLYIKLYLVCKAFIQVIFGLILVCIFLPNNYYRTQLMTKVASMIGHLLAAFNIYIEGY